VLVVSSDLRQLMDFGVAFRGDIYAPILAQCADVLARASANTGAGSGPVIVCLNGKEKAGEIAEFLAADPLAVWVGPAKALGEPLRRTLEAFEQMLFDHATPAVVVLAGLIAVAKDRSLSRQSVPRGSRVGRLRRPGR
jgi:hypothetical protein